MVGGIFLFALCIDRLNLYAFVREMCFERISRSQGYALGPPPCSIAGDDVRIPVGRLSKHHIEDVGPSEGRVIRIATHVLIGICRGVAVGRVAVCVDIC